MAKRLSAKDQGDVPPDQAGFIFRGTVQRVGESTAPGANADRDTAVVRVDETLAAPPALTHLAGREVTVVASSPLTPGQQAIFHTASMSFGQEIVVRAVRVEPLPSGAPATGIAAVRAAAAPLAASQAAAADPAQAHRDLMLKRSLDAADMVVTGTVTAVRLAPETEALATGAAPVGAAVGVRGAPTRGAGAATAGATGATTASATPARISEHDPLWREAVVKVESVEKGSTPQKEVVVRFPGSNDVRWRQHPKFRTGQQGVFLLNTTAPSEPGAAAAVSRGAAARAIATAVPSAAGAMQARGEPEPVSAIDKIRQLLATPSPAVSARATGGVGPSRGRSTPVARGRGTSRSKK